MNPESIYVNFFHILGNRNAYFPDWKEKRISTHGMFGISMSQIHLYAWLPTPRVVVIPVRWLPPGSNERNGQWRQIRRQFVVANDSCRWLCYVTNCRCSHGARRQRNLSCSHWDRCGSWNRCGNFITNPPYWNDLSESAVWWDCRYVQWLARRSWERLGQTIVSYCGVICCL